MSRVSNLFRSLSNEKSFGEVSNISLLEYFIYSNYYKSKENDQSFLKTPYCRLIAGSIYRKLINYDDILRNKDFLGK